MDINIVTLIGRLVKDPVLIDTGNSYLCSFTLANNRKDNTLFIDCAAWGKTAEMIKKNCHKKTQVCVSGRLQQNSWTSKDGKRNSKIEIIIDEEGNARLDFQGFKGNECFKQADELYALLKQSGINVVAIKETPSRREVEIRIEQKKKRERRVGI